MMNNKMVVGVLIEEPITYIEVCNKYHIPKELLIEMMEQGLFSNQSTQLEQLVLSQRELRRIESAFRLHQDLGVNLEGAVLAIELLERIEQMDNELQILRKHF